MRLWNGCEAEGSFRPASTIWGRLRPDLKCLLHHLFSSLGQEGVPRSKSFPSVTRRHPHHASSQRRRKRGLVDDAEGIWCLSRWPEGPCLIARRWIGRKQRPTASICCQEAERGLVGCVQGF